MKLVIQTQHAENYGAHDWNGKGACPQNWKFKSGDTYVVPNMTPAQIEKVKAKGIPTLKALIEVRNTHFEETIIGWGVVEDDAVVCDAWESPTELFYEQGRWVARHTEENGEYGCMRMEIASKTEQYDMVAGGERANYEAVYTLHDGRKVLYKDLAAALKDAA